MSSRLSPGTVHPVPPDVRKAVLSLPKVHALWEDITPLARNEWICWVTSGKKQDTRGIRIEKMLSKMKGRYAPAVLLGRVSAQIAERVGSASRYMGQNTIDPVSNPNIQGVGYNSFRIVAKQYPA